MAVFAIIGRGTSNGLRDRVKEVFPAAEEWSDRTWIVNSDESAQAIARKMGVGERQSDGTTHSDYGHVLVMQVGSSYWGYGPTPFWDGVRSVFQKAS